MLKLAWRGVRHNLGRYLATIIAIMTGVAFFASAGFLSDRVISALEGDATRQFGGVDVAVVPDDSTGSEFAGDLRIAGSVADQIAELPNVEAVSGDLSAPVAFRAPDGSAFGDGAVGRLWIADDELNPVDIVEGAAPVAQGEIAVDRGLADRESLGLGDDVVVLTASGQFDASIVGITAFGGTDALDRSGTVSVPAPTAFDWLNQGVVEYEDLYIRGAGSQSDLVAEVEPLVPEGYATQTGEEFLQDKRDEAGAFGRTLKIGLQAFAVLALLVGAFVIYNTFSVIVAQRLRELAVLAAIGATPKQIKRSLRLEGLAIGLLGSALGVVAGFALTFLLVAVLSAFGFDLPGSGLEIGSNVIVSSMFAGTAITFFSVMVPARRAAKTEPIEALRQAAVETGSVPKSRIVFSLVLVALGLVLLFSGSPAGLGFGTVLLFVGVVLAGPLLALVASTVFRPITSRFGLEGRLAADNTARNPQRTATTSNALLIGVFLVTLVTVAGTSIKDFAVAEINQLSGADFFALSAGGEIDDELAAQLGAVDDVETVVTFRRAAITIDGSPSAISTGDVDAIVSASGLELDSGSFDDLGPDSVVVSGGFAGGSADSAAPVVGDTVTIAGPSGSSADLTVVGVLSGSIDAQFTGSIVTDETFTTIEGAGGPNAAFIDAVDGTQSDVEDALDEVLSLRPDISLVAGSGLAETIGGIFDFLINAVNGLLVMSVVIALIGIVNTMSLSILERRRELGLLRVVGMVDRRVRRMVRIESVIIATLGTVTGMLVGGITGWAITQAINRAADSSVGFSPPIGMLLVVLVLGIGLGFVAALIPAQRSTRLEVLEAIQTT